jgi:hypothetical protein
MNQQLFSIKSRLTPTKAKRKSIKKGQKMGVWRRCFLGVLVFCGYRNKFPKRRGIQL